MAILSVVSGTEQPLVGLALSDISSKIPLSEEVSLITVRLPGRGTYGPDNSKPGKWIRNQHSKKAGLAKQHHKKWRSSAQPFTKALVHTKPADKVEIVSKTPMSFIDGPAVVKIPVPLTIAKPNGPVSKGKRGKWTTLSLKSPSPSSSNPQINQGPVLGSRPDWVVAAASKFASGTFSNSSYRTSVNRGPGWAKVAIASPGSHHLTEKNFPGLRCQQSGGKKPPVLAVPNTLVQPCNVEQFPLGHFPSLGAKAPAKKDLPTEWEPEGWSEWDGNYVTTKSLAEIAREKERELEDQRYWAEYRKKEEAKERAAALERERRRNCAMKVAEELRKWGKMQFCLPKELWIQILMQLHSTDRKSFMLTCKDAFGIFSELITVWDVTKGYFDGSVKVGRAPVGNGANPTTQHSVTIIKADRTHEKKGFIGHETIMAKKMTMALYHMADHFRSLEFHSTPLLTNKMLCLLIPELKNLEYLGIFHCELLDIRDTENLLYYIRAGNRKNDVQLDFYPSTNLLYYKQIQFSVAVPALLYRILPKSLAQNARLMDPGRAFPEWLRSCHLSLSTELLRHIELDLQDEDVLTEIGSRKYHGSKTRFAANSNEAKLFQCRSCDLEFRGCFFAKAQISGTNAEDAICWGCRLEEEILFEKCHDWGFIDQYDAVNKGWLDESLDVETMLRLAHEHVSDPANHKKDITFGQKFRDREEAEELQRLIRKGVIKPGQKSIPNSKKWARPKKSSRYNCSYKEYVEF